MKWRPAPVIKVYEALGAIGDNRIKINGNTAKVYSSSGNKYYQVTYDPESNAITSNDNVSYHVGYLGYPSIAFLLKKGVINYDHTLPRYLQGIAWKDINVAHQNDFDATQQHVDALMQDKFNLDIDSFHGSLQAIADEVTALKLYKMSSPLAPPDAY